MHPRRILCPIDFSDNSHVALKFASEEAAQFAAKLFVVHVENVRQTARPGTPAYVKELDEHKRLLQEGKPTVDDIDYEQHYLRGNVVDELIRFADAREVDRIVMGTHGRTGVKRILMGSVATAVGRIANCEVVMISEATGKPIEFIDNAKVP
ncbi:universal stress protein, partial [Planctomycetota bacterium]